MSDDRTELVFVYGTLRKEGTNHFRMDGAEYQGTAVVRGRLYQIDWYPGLILDREAGEVAGEVYEVSREQLAALDEFEGAEYRRIEAEVMRSDPYFRQMVWLWEYAAEVDEGRRIKRGDWIEACRGRVLPLCLWIAWSPALLVLVLGAVAVVMTAFSSLSPSPPSSARAGVIEMVTGLGALVSVPIVMTVGGFLAMRRGERPQVLARISFSLGLLGLGIMLCAASMLLLR